MLAIKNNLMAENAARHLGRSYDSLSTSVERLASGLRINSAKDDAAGLAVRELLRADVAVFRQASRNANDGVSMLQTAEGAMASIDEILVRMKELAEQSATGTYNDDQRALMDAEFQELVEEIDRIADSAEFNGIFLLNDSTGTNYDIHVGDNTNVIQVTAKDTTAAGLGVGGTKAYGAIMSAVEDASAASWINVTAGGNLNFNFTNQGTLTVALTTQTYSMSDLVDAINSASRASDDYNAAEIVTNDETGLSTIKVSAEYGGTETLTISHTATLATDLLAAAEWSTEAGTGTAISIDSVTNAQTALGALDDAIDAKDAIRAEFGYLMNRMEQAARVLDIQAENMLAAESRISDVDVATEMASMTRNQVLAQAGVSMLAQANAMPQMALQLLG
ncbi:MAG: flagellin [Phycisphaerae bacterium]